MDDLLKRYNEADDAYKQAFGCYFPTELAADLPEEEIIEEMHRCIATGRPFEPQVPEGCIT